jgi:UMF1 family MFS transporter
MYGDIGGVVLAVKAEPIVGAYADARAAKRRVLFVATPFCVLSNAMLYGVGTGTLVLARTDIIISNFCYAVGENMTATFLPELARPEAVDKASGWGWAWGPRGLPIRG